MKNDKSKVIDVWVIRHVDDSGRHHASALAHIYLFDGTMLSFNWAMRPVVGMEAFYCVMEHMYYDGYTQFRRADLLTLNGWRVTFYDLGEHDEIICRCFGE